MASKYSFKRALLHRQKAEALCDAMGLSCHSDMYRRLVEEAYADLDAPAQSVDAGDLGNTQSGNDSAGRAPTVEELQNLQDDGSTAEAPDQSSKSMGIPGPFRR